MLICNTLYWCAENLAHQTPFRAHQSPFETHHQGGLPSLRSAFPKWGEFQGKNKPSCLRQHKQKIKNRSSKLESGFLIFFAFPLLGLACFFFGGEGGIRTPGTLASTSV